MGGSPGAKLGEPHPLSCPGRAPRRDGSVLPPFPSWSCGDGGLVGLSAERDQSQEAAGCSAAQELQSTPLPFLHVQIPWPPRRAPQRAHHWVIFCFYKILFIPTSQLRNQATRDPQGARSTHSQLSGSIPLCPSWPEAPRSVIESPEPDLNPKLCVSVKCRGCLGIRFGCPMPRFFSRAVTS